MDVKMYTRDVLTGRGYTLRSFMYAPVVNPSGNSITITCTPVLFFSYRSRTLGKDDHASFKITPRNYQRVMEFFLYIQSWFAYEKYKDLFIVDEGEGKLILNMDFQELRALINGSKYDNQAMLAIPAVVDIDSKQSPGIALSVNNTKYTMALTHEDVTEIYGVLANFNFQIEPLLLTTIGQNGNFWEDKPVFEDTTFQPGTLRMNRDSGTSRAVKW